MNFTDLIIGVPYEIEIEPSIDLGNFTAELCIEDENVDYNIELKRSEGFKHTLILPNIFNDRSEFTYKIYLYKDNARFEVDSGKINILKDVTNKQLKDKNVPTAKIQISKKEDVVEPTVSDTPPVEQSVDIPTVSINTTPETPFIEVKPETTPEVTKERKAMSFIQEISKSSDKKTKLNDSVKNIIKDIKTKH